MTSARNTLKTLLAATTLAMCPVSPLLAQPGMGGGSPVITLACRDQEKPPCLIETRYLPEPDGSNVTKIMLAFLAPERKTNSQSIPYYNETNFTLSPRNDFAAVTGYTALAEGMGLALPQGTKTRGPARLISVEKLKPEIAKPRLPRSASPAITITEPKGVVTSQPMIDVKGVSDRPLRSVRFSVVNAAQRMQNRQGFVTDSYFDTARWETTTNYFECLDIPLAPGTDSIIVSCEDLAGHRVTTNLVYLLRLDQDKAPPVMSIQWPIPGRQLSGDFFTARGQIDDTTARIAGRISAGGQINKVEGNVERNGRFWVEHIPLLGTTNLLTLTATDAAGNSTIANLSVIKSANTLTIDSVPPDQLWQLQVTVIGKVNPPDQNVWLNGRQATVKPDGIWVVTGVLLNQEGVAIFEAVAVSKATTAVPLLADIVPPSVIPKEFLSVQASLGYQSITLNANQPTYGAFNLHLTGTAGRSYILCASTNLVDWMPLLTNRNAAATFDNADTNVAAYGCRFFRVIPID